MLSICIFSLILWRICSKLEIKYPTTPCICAHTVTLILWNINVRKHAINDKLQGTGDSIATYLKCGEVVNNQSEKGLLLSLSVKKMIKTGKYFAKLQERTWLSHALTTLSHTAKRQRKCTRQSHSCLQLCHNVTQHQKYVATARACGQ